MTDDRPTSRSSTETVSRRTYTRLLGALGVGSGLPAAQSMRSDEDDVAAAAPDERADRRGLTVSDSGAPVDRDVTHLDFEGALTPVGPDDDGDEAGSVRIQAADDSSNANIVDVRDDLGVEPQQGDVWGAIYDHYQSFSPSDRNHRYVLPAGTWHVETDNVHLNAHEYFGLVGEPFATLKVTSQDVDRMMTVGRIDDSLPHAQRTVMKDIQVDIRGQYDAGIGRWYTYSYGLIENVSMRGRRDRLNPTYGGDRHTIMIDGRQTTTTNIIRGCQLNNGDTNYDRDTHVGHAIPFSSEIYNRGTNIWEACQVTGYVDNGFYVSNNSGRNIITGCHARNCAGAGIRIGANDYVRNCRITMTEQPGHPWSGLWLENGGGQIVDGLTVHNSIEKNTEIIRLTQDGPARLVGVHITDNGGNGRAIRVADNHHTRTVFHGCSITDRTSPTVSDYAVYVRSSNVVFKDCEYDLESQTDQDRHGFFVTRESGNISRFLLENSDIDADGASLRFGASGGAHNVEGAIFDGAVLSDPGTTLKGVLWIGNRHRAGADFRGERVNWKGDFNFGFTV